MRILLDTHLLLWASGQPARLPVRARAMLVDERNQLVFSVVSLWEIAIKRGLGRDDFHVDSRLLRRSLIDNDYEELALTGQHAVTVDGLPAIHRDPFDRLLVAQSMVEGITLLTSDVMVAQYAGTVLLV